MKNIVLLIVFMFYIPVFFCQKAEVHLEAGIAKEAEGNYKAAILEYNKALKINNHYVEAFVNRGIAKNYLGDFRGAILDYNHALMINPNSSETYNLRGEIHNTLGEYK